MTIDAMRLQSQIDELFDRQRQVEVNAATVSTRLQSLKESVDGISANMNKLVWAIVAAILASLLQLVIR